MDTLTTISQMSIHEAAKEGNDEVVQAWLEKDPNLVDSRDSFENTPLQYAAYSGYASIVKLLLDYKADPCAENETQLTPLCLIVGQPEITDQHHEIVKLLLQAGISAHQLTTLDKEGDSLLHVAAKQRHIEIVRLFLMHGANPNALDSEGKPAWYEAYPFADTLCIFLKHPDIDLRIGFEGDKTILLSTVYTIKSLTQQSDTLPLETSKRHKECLKYLIFSGVDIDDRAIEETCNRYAPGSVSVDFYPHIKELIDAAVAMKEKAVAQFNTFGLPSYWIRHFLLSSGDARKAFLEKATIMLSLRHPKEILDQIIEEALLDDYRFPNLASNELKEISPRP